MSFQNLGLSSRILRALEDHNYQEPSPIQRKAIPLISRGHDVIACAQTGTGKTAAFSLPLIARIEAAAEKWRRTSVLILSPTRELASQIAENIDCYTKYLPIRSTAIYGGVSMDSQLRVLRKGVNLLVATPGRLLDHLRQGTVDLSEVETLVLDEADNMLDMGFIQDVRRIIQALPRSGRQNLLFSATFSEEIRNLTRELLHKPKVVQVAPENKPIEVIDQKIYHVDRSRRKELLSHLVGEGDWKQVLVFTRTKRGANRLAEQLTGDGFETLAIHGNKSQNARTQALDSFKKGKARILVATDIAARGIDIQNLPYVVNYDLPQVPENYVHRIGRTGRAGKTGKAVSLVCVDDFKLLRGIESMLKKQLTKEIVPGYEPDPSILPQPSAQPRGPGRRRPTSQHGRRNARSSKPSHSPNESRHRRRGERS